MAKINTFIGLHTRACLFLPRFVPRRQNIRYFSYPAGRRTSNVLTRTSFNAIKNAVNKLENTIDIFDMTLEPLRVHRASLGYPFTSAQLEVFPYFVDQDGQPLDVIGDNYGPVPRTRIVSFYELYSDGFEILRSLINSAEHEFADKNGKDFKAEVEWKYGDTYEIIYAVQSLSDFFSHWKRHETSLRSAFDTQEEKILIPVLACHLISKLCSFGDYLVTNDGSMGKQSKICPCSEGCLERVKYGSTHFGHVNLWYGHPDILPQNYKDGCQLVLLKDRSEKLGYDAYTVGSDSQELQLFEVKLPTSFVDVNQKAMNQVIAQAITFAFCQCSTQEKNPEKFNRIVSLIPTVVLTDRRFKVYMYDFENDILLESSTVNLFQRGYLNHIAILQLWMLIHHYWLNPRLMENEFNFLRNSAGFQEIPEVKGHLQHFKKEVEYTSKQRIERFRKRKEILEGSYQRVKFEKDKKMPVNYRYSTRQGDY